ncbi:PLP-dependent aminotransferase family protein [Dyadobacter sp. CY261]|uniref:aminotransferase-like domain-containing protein n=1 Tax=Dyadobacter sp. CY261 TaxID=2907203 RepID=UPI001F27484F|nr:PLP-dependent aminotransferase family protein [Dyadobacter sp. CY261]MCF0074259.1 PLP-dependent aminotransferase family protein [Dyadobacter sp. CY261]
MIEKQFRYVQIATKIEDIISRNHLRPGDKIPSVRHISKELSVSMATVVQAYSLLDAKGVVVSRPKSGYYVAKPYLGQVRPVTQQSFIPLPETVEVNTMATAMIKNTRKYGVVNFSTLAPSKEMMPTGRLNKALIQATRQQLDNQYLYPFLEGSPRLQAQIALQSMNWTRPASSDEILVTNGCMEAISLCLDVLTQPGDIVAVECPTYAGLLQCLESRGLQVLGIEVDPQQGLNVDQLEQAIATHSIAACIFSPACHNPLGCAMPEQHKIRLVRLLAAHRVPLIEDDALGELHFGATRPLPAKAYDDEGNVLYCSSFSKTLTPGFRIGWVSGGKRHSGLERHKFASNIATNSLLQEALSNYLESGHYHSHVKKLRNTLKEQITKYQEAIAKYFPFETRVSDPQGGYSLWLELPEKIQVHDLQRLALKKGIGFCPGQIFSVSKAYHHYIRINCGSLFNNIIDGGLKELGVLVHQLALVEDEPVN